MFEDTDKIFRAICAGASGYLLKTSPAEKIAQAIREVLGGGAPMTPQIARSVLNLFARLAGPPPEQDLSQRERETLEFLVQGLTTKEIADRLALSIQPLTPTCAIFTASSTSTHGPAPSPARSRQSYTEGCKSLCVL